MGGALFLGGTVLSTAASILGSDAQERAYYRSMAATAEAQARQVEENARRNSNYIFQDAAYQNTQLARNYASLLGQQKTSLAYNGIDTNSSTAQLIFKNSRLNAQMDQEMLAQNTHQAIYETQTQAALEAEQYRTQAQQYRRARKNRLKLWSRIGSAMSGLFNVK